MSTAKNMFLAAGIIAVFLLHIPASAGDQIIGFDGTMYAVGDNDTLAHYNGTAWVTMSPAVKVKHIWGAASAGLYAIGRDPASGRSNIMHYSGSWSVVYNVPHQPDPNEPGYYESTGLTGIWGVSSTDVFVTGGAYMQQAWDNWPHFGIKLHYDGVSWTQSSSGDDYCYYLGVGGSSSSDVWAVGFIAISSIGIYGPRIKHFNGSEWDTVTSAGGSDLSAVWAASSTDVFAVGLEGLIIHYDGMAWAEMDSGTSYFLSDVWGSSATDVFACGPSGTILHYDGSAWSAMDTGAPQSVTFQGLWGNSSTSVFAVGRDSALESGKDTVIYHYDGSSWMAMTYDRSSTTTTVHASTTTTTAHASTTTTTAHASTTTTTAHASTTTTTPGGDDNNAPCPATEALGADNQQLVNLRYFRDHLLAQTVIGRKLIAIYYDNAESMSAALKRSSALRVCARWALETTAPMLGRHSEQ